MALGGLGLGHEGRARDFRGGRDTVAKMHCALWIAKLILAFFGLLLVILDRNPKWLSQYECSNTFL